MKTRVLLILVGCIACVDRSAPTSEFRLTAEEMCEAYCELADLCWHREVLPYRFEDDMDGCIADCVSLDAAWTTDSLGRLECADFIYEARACYLSYDGCEAVDDAQIPGRWGSDARCADEVQAVVINHCTIPDPRTYP